MADRVFTPQQIDLALVGNEVLRVHHSTRRWAERYEIAFRADDELVYRVFRDEPLTEIQEIPTEEAFPDAVLSGDGKSMSVVCPQAEIYDKQITVKRIRLVTDDDE